MEMLLLMVVFIGLMYVLMVLPQKKKMDAQKKMLGALQPGARVMLNTGMFGTIRAIGDKQMVIELAPGVEVTVLRQTVMRAVAPNEEEFEYSDESEAAAVVAAPVHDAFVSDALPPSSVGAEIAGAEPTGSPSFEPAETASEIVEAAPVELDEPPATDDDRRQGR